MISGFVDLWGKFEAMDYRKRTRNDVGANVNGGVKKYKPGNN